MDLSFQLEKIPQEDSAKVYQRIVDKDSAVRMTEPAARIVEKERAFSSTFPIETEGKPR